MKELMLRTNKGIAGEFMLRSMDDVMKFVPYCHHWEGAAGSSTDAVYVTAVMADGTETSLEYEQAHAREYEKAIVREARPIGEQIAGRAVKALVFRRDLYISYRDDADKYYTEVLFITPPDYMKIRQRIEDRLREAEDSEIIRLAILMGVKIY